MNKKEFQELIKKHKKNYSCLALCDATIRHGFPHTALEIRWKGFDINSRKTVVRCMRGRTTDLKNLIIKNKYLKYIEQIN